MQKKYNPNMATNVKIIIDKKQAHGKMTYVCRSNASAKKITFINKNLQWPFSSKLVINLTKLLLFRCTAKESVLSWICLNYSLYALFKYWPMQFQTCLFVICLVVIDKQKVQNWMQTCLVDGHIDWLKQVWDYARIKQLLSKIIS